MVLWLGVLPRCSFWLGTSEGLAPGRLMMTMNYLGSRCAQGYTMRLCQRLRTSVGCFALRRVGHEQCLWTPRVISTDSYLPGLMTERRERARATSCSGDHD